MNINQYSTIIVCREELYKIVDKQAWICTYYIIFHNINIDAFFLQMDTVLNVVHME